MLPEWNITKFTRQKSMRASHAQAPVYRVSTLEFRNQPVAKQLEVIHGAHFFSRRKHKWIFLILSLPVSCAIVSFRSRDDRISAKILFVERVQILYFCENSINNWLNNFHLARGELMMVKRQWLTQLSRQLNYLFYFIVVSISPVPVRTTSKLFGLLLRTPEARVFNLTDIR